MYLNKVMLIGNLTRDPEMRSLPSGIQVASIGLATNRVWKDKAGAKQESTEFHNIVIFGRRAEVVGQYLKKGSSVLVEGRIQTRSWDAKDGTKKTKTEIIADQIQFGPKRDGSFSGGGATKSAAATPAKEKELETIEYPSEEVNPDDIPF